jgi:hypothetical protein
MRAVFNLAIHTMQALTFGGVSIWTLLGMLFLVSAGAAVWWVFVEFFKNQ